MKKTSVHLDSNRKIFLSLSFIKDMLHNRPVLRETPIRSAASDAFIHGSDIIPKGGCHPSPCLAPLRIKRRYDSLPI